MIYWRLFASTVALLALSACGLESNSDSSMNSEPSIGESHAPIESDGDSQSFAAAQAFIKASQNPCARNAQGGCAPVQLQWGAPVAIKLVVKETGKILSRAAKGAVASPAIPASGLTFELRNAKNAVLAAVAVRPAAKPGPGPGPATGLTATEQSLVDAINAERAKGGLAALRVESHLVSAAQIQATNMARLNKLEHSLPETTTPELADRFHAAGYVFSMGAENIASNYPTNLVVQGWMTSPGHRDNIMNPAFTETGFAIRLNAAGQPYYCQVFGKPR